MARTSFARPGRSVPSLVVAALTALALAVSGCTEPVTMYQVPGGYVAQGQKILVLPFMDTRTFVDNNDQHKYDLGYHARNIFIQAVREQTGGGAVIVAPNIPQPTRSMTGAEVAELGRRHGADVVVAGQIFSFTETRAASIPPRAGMFVRVISAADGALLFVGDHYQAANVPGASGGRDLQARLVSTRLVEGFLERAAPLAEAAGRVASSTALAALLPIPVALPASLGVGREPTGNNDLKPKSDSAPDWIGTNLPNLEDWDDSMAPEVPPLLDIGGEVPPPPPSVSPEKPSVPPEKPVVPPAGALVALPPPVSPQPAADKNADVAPPLPAPENDAAEKADAVAEDAGKMEGVENAEVAQNEKTPEDAEVSEGDADIDLAADLEDLVGDDVMSPTSPESASEAPALPEEPEAASSEPPEPNPAAEPAPAPRARAVEAAPPLRPEPASPPAPEAVLTVDAVQAMEIDELPEFDLGATELSMDEAEQARIVDANNLSGDDLASDLFATDGDPWPGSAEPSPAAGHSTAADAVPYVSPRQPAEILSPVAPSATPDYGPFQFDPDTLEVIDPARPAVPRPARQPAPRPQAVAPMAGPAPAAAGVRAPARASAAGSGAGVVPVVPQVTPRSFEDGEDGRVVSTPLMAEQPTPHKYVDLIEHEADPDNALPDAEPLVEAPSQTARPDAVSLLVLPYHDRENPNNLIPNTGGGEVVTTLFGTQLAVDPGIRLMWDASGEANHTRLLSREEALAMGRLLGADYVMRGQVIEFRRAQSVPSLYSAVISTAVLAAQVFFAEMSGVDVATEVYRVADGLCVMSRRDRAQQKYVVQAEKTVRRMAKGMAESVIPALMDDNPEEMDPLIDEVEPAILLANPR